MTRRLVVTGFPCSSAPWVELFHDGGTKVLTLAQVIEKANSGDLRQMASVVLEIISELNPDHIVAHDIGVTITILALLRGIKMDKVLPQSLVLFNGAFSGFDVLKARHPIWIQLKSANMIEKELANIGIKLDPDLVSQMPLIKKMYRQIILSSLAESLKSFRSNSMRTVKLPIKTLILEGVDDPFIPKSSIDSLAHTLNGSARVVGYKGHFPYQGDSLKILSVIENWVFRQMCG